MSDEILRMGWKHVCQAAHLAAPVAFWKDSELNIERIYNGAGPDTFDGWPRWFLRHVIGMEDPDEGGRKLLTAFLEIYEPAFVIHDWEYNYSDHTEESWHEANERMLRNMGVLLDAAYPVAKVWLWPIRARWYLRMRAAWRAVESDAGYEAWIE